jgi:predicted ATPase
MVARSKRQLDRAVRQVRRDTGFHPNFATWPACVPAVGQLLRRGLELPAGLTVLVGENGSGKSTLIELIAEAYGLNPQGGSQTARYRARPTEPGLGEHLIVERGAVRPHWAYFIRADTTHGLYTYLEENPSNAPEPTFHEMSHGEGFLSLLATKVNDVGFYLLDEPDAALSFTSSLGLVAILRDLVQAGSQIIVGTHSPIIAATPGATIFELGAWGVRRVEWPQLELVGAWRNFLVDPSTYFRHLFDDQ